MAGMCLGAGGETETTAPVEPSSKSARRKRMEIHHFKFVAADISVYQPENGQKKQKVEVLDPVSQSRGCENAVQNSEIGEKRILENGQLEARSFHRCPSPSSAVGVKPKMVRDSPKFGMTSVCGRRRDMEDAVSVHSSFCCPEGELLSDFHFFGVFDGHGCSHVAMKCRDRMHEIVKDELESHMKPVSWKESMMRSFSRMDNEIREWCNVVGVSNANCRCELQTPKCDAVGSTAVVAVVTPYKIVVSNCGDSRTVLCRNGTAIPLSTDHKPDRADELNRIEEAGGRVIYWDGARVLGVLAMSRAIGDYYLKPYVISEPEVTVTERTAEDEFLILASDGLWDVVSNETACKVARMCLKSWKSPCSPRSPGSESGICAATIETSDKACSDASVLLTKLALARHSTDNVSVVVVDLRRDL